MTSSNAFKHAFKHKTINTFTEQLGKKTQSVNEIWPVYVILQKKKFYQKTLQKLRPEN